MDSPVAGRMTAGLSGVDWTKFPGNTKTPLSVTTTPREPDSASTILVYHRNSATLGGLATPTRSMGMPAHLSRSEEHTSELQSLMRISYAVFCLKQKNTTLLTHTIIHTIFLLE